MTYKHFWNIKHKHKLQFINHQRCFPHHASFIFTHPRTANLPVTHSRHLLCKHVIHLPFSATLFVWRLFIRVWIEQCCANQHVRYAHHLSRRATHLSPSESNNTHEDAHRTQKIYTFCSCTTSNCYSFAGDFQLAIVLCLELWSDASKNYLQSI